MITVSLPSDMLQELVWLASHPASVANSGPTLCLVGMVITSQVSVRLLFFFFF